MQKGEPELKSPLDRALELAEGDWQTCTLDITLDISTVEVGEMATHMGAKEILDNGRQVTIFRERTHFNRDYFLNMLRHYFEQFPNLQVSFGREPEEPDPLELMKYGSPEYRTDQVLAASSEQASPQFTDAEKARYTAFAHETDIDLKKPEPTPGEQTGWFQSRIAGLMNFIRG